MIISASPIPGNERYVYKVINQLFRRGANVIYSALNDVHVSGHARKGELSLMHTLVKPKYFMPVHGEYRHLIMHGRLAEKLGMRAKNVIIPDTGSVYTLSRNEFKKTGKVASGGVMIDGLGVGDVGSVVLRDRKHMSQDGMIIVDGHHIQTGRRSACRAGRHLERFCIYEGVRRAYRRHEKHGAGSHKRQYFRGRVRLDLRYAAR